MNTFENLGLEQSILQGITEMGFVSPTPIQAEVIPYMLTNQTDIIGLAQTGTGKTAAFGLPLIQLVDTQTKTTQGLVLSPTRELCMQIASELRKYSAQKKGMHIVAVYGGEDIMKQLKQLDKTPQILVATPGRLIDLIKRRKVSLSNINHLILDEADEMLKMGFLDDITTIFEETPETRQTLLFSATMPTEISSIARRYMSNAKEITVGTKNEGTKNVEHVCVVVRKDQKYMALKRILDNNPDIYGIIFCRTRQQTKDIADMLIVDSYNADALHGDLSQAQRDMVMHKFRIKNLQILVATDVAARGLDVNNLTHVINYDLPDDKETYTHRSGRTGRVNKSGISIAIVTPREKSSLSTIERAINRKFKQELIPTGAEACQKQLFHLIQRMRDVEVNEDLSENYLGEIFETLQDMTKEEVISRFVSLEFNHFLSYYQDAKDLNKDAQGGGDRGDGRGLRGDRGDRRTSKSDRIRLKIDQGRNEGYEPKRLLKLINEVTDSKDINIGDIEVTGKFTFFDVDKDQYIRLKSAFATSHHSKNIELNEVKGSRTSGAGSSPRSSEPRRQGGRFNDSRKPSSGGSRGNNNSNSNNKDRGPKPDRVSKRTGW
ncbi:MAG: DEAD/DEAH box helicase [Paludibacteraceae bacterium]|nr:DEAD/DEAH box helicase [Paludibacteraceae bacterium]